MTEHRSDELQAKLAMLEREATPSRDLWPDIAAAIAESAREPRRELLNVLELPVRRRRFNSTRLWQMAAAALLMVGSSAVTYVLTQRTLQGEVQQARQQVIQQLQPVLPATPASFGYQRLGPEYSRVRAELDAQSTRYLRSLPPAERAKIERSLADLRRAASDLSAQLAEHPSDPLLQELLLSTYQNELGLLTRVSDLGATALGAEL